MTIAELLECEVIDPSGQVIGEVHDVRFERRNTGVSGEYHLTYLMFSPGAVFRRLGYGYGMKRPWLLYIVFRWLAGHRGRAVRWEHISRLEAGAIHIDVPASQLPSVLDLTRGAHA
ncbi:MAG: hypothetical protein ACJ735_06270 [Actinomycetes bacterium]